MKVKVAAVQMESKLFKQDENLKKAEKMIEEAVALGAGLIVLPELFSLGYSWSREMGKFSETKDGKTLTWMKNQSEKHQIILAGTFLEKEGRSTYSSFVLSEKGSTSFARKLFPIFPEWTWCKKGKRPQIITTGIGEIGPAICWDIVHGELARFYKDKIDLVIACYGWPCSPRVPILGKFKTWDRWVLQAPSRTAKFLKVPVVVASLSGPFASRIPFIPFGISSHLAGSSALFDRDGKLIKKLSQNEEGVVSATLEI